MICSISPRAAASTTLVGTILISMCDISMLFFDAAVTAAASVAVICKPWPGSNTFTTVKPTTNARVVAASNQMMDFNPSRPSFLKSPVPAIPIISELKIKGTTIILIIRINMSPIGLRSTAMAGNRCPNITPRIKPKKIWVVRPNFHLPFFIVKASPFSLRPASSYVGVLLLPPLAASCAAASNSLLLTKYRKLQDTTKGFL